MPETKTTREIAYAAVDSERDYQDAGRGNAKRHENEAPIMRPGEYILCMERYLNAAREAWNKPNGGVACLDDIRKVTALGVACMEYHGAPLRNPCPKSDCAPRWAGTTDARRPE